MRKAEAARTDLEWSRLISEAERYCRDLKRDARDTYSYSTLVKAGIQRLTRVLDEDELFKGEDLEASIKGVERDSKKDSSGSRTILFACTGCRTGKDSE